MQSNSYASDSFVTQQQLTKMLDTTDTYKDDLLDLFEVKDESRVIKIGNSKQLLNAIAHLDSQCIKVNLKSKIKDVYLDKMLEKEKATFDIFHVKNDFIVKTNKSDQLSVETRYSAKSDLLDIYDLSKFANYCRDKNYDDLVDIIKEYLRKKNINNSTEKGLRTVYNKAENKFYLRAVTSVGDYREYGINFSVFVAIMALDKYAESKQSEVYIDNYSVDESTLYVSFTLNSRSKIDDKLSLSFNLILENDEIKRNAVSFNGLVKLIYTDQGKESEIYLRPRGVKKDPDAGPVDLLTYAHRGSVANVFEKIEHLPKLIDFFIDQVSEDAKKISSIRNPDDVKVFIAGKVRKAKKEEFKVYKDKILRILTRINVDNTFMLFDMLRQVDDLFEHDDIVSRNFWRSKLYQAMIEKL